MKFSPIDLLAPHYCCNCGQIGRVLCDSCKYDIESERSAVCIQCRAPITTGRCRDCPRIFEAMYMVGPREKALKQLIDLTKFESVRQAADTQAELLAGVVPSSVDAVIVPIPTIRPHVRRRGYGHTERMARSLAHLTDGFYSSLLIRQGRAVQHGATRAERLRQAAGAFVVNQTLDPDCVYIVVDDVTTTGATLREAAKQLQAAGARHIYAAVTTYQKLD